MEVDVKELDVQRKSDAQAGPAPTTLSRPTLLKDKASPLNTVVSDP